MQDKHNVRVTNPGTVDIRTYIHKLNKFVTVIQCNTELIALKEDCKENAEETLDAYGQILNILNTLRQTL